MKYSRINERKYKSNSVVYCTNSLNLLEVIDETELNIVEIV